MNRTIMLLIIVVLALVACGGPGDTYAPLAQCLTEKGVKEYGAFWCPNCARQEKAFGDGYQYITYIECDPRGDNAQPDLCISKNIDKYPTWEFSDGSILVGTQEMSVLAEKSGCTLPEEDTDTE